jgi:tRNA pseudouridine38-40 synthase
MKNIRCLVSYDGTRYFGFQKTKMGPSIEEELEKALRTLLRHPVKIQGASRTDRGVHAEGQVVHFFTDSALDLKRTQKSLVGLLPKDICPKHLEQVAPSFHPSVDAKKKEYEYSICAGTFQLPFHQKYSWHFPQTLKRGKMEEAKELLIGENNFSAFTLDRYDNPIRLIESITLFEEGNRLKIRVVGESFLYKMVRKIVGTLIYVGCGKISLADLPEILAGGDQRLSGMTAPAHGLCLKRVFY